MTKDEALKLALEYVELVQDDRYNAEHIDREALVTAIKEALAQPEQEYHAVNAVHKGQQCYVKTQTEQDSGIVTAGGFDPRTQRTWVGLTEAQCGVLWKTNMTPFEYYQAIEAKLRSKNGY